MANDKILDLVTSYGSCRENYAYAYMQFKKTGSRIDKAILDGAVDDMMIALRSIVIALEPPPANICIDNHRKNKP